MRIGGFRERERENSTSSMHVNVCSFFWLFFSGCVIAEADGLLFSHQGMKDPKEIIATLTAATKVYQEVLKLKACVVVFLLHPYSNLHNFWDYFV